MDNNASMEDHWSDNPRFTCKHITTEPFKPGLTLHYNTEAVLVEEMQRMAKRILELEALLERQTALLERQTARIVDLQTHIENFDGEDR